MGTQEIIDFTIFSAVCFSAHVYHNFFKKKRPTLTKDPAIYKKKSVVVITGCDTGFGNLLSRELAKQSDNLIVVSLCLTSEAAKELNLLDDIQSVQCDVTSDEDVQRARDFIEAILVEEKAVLKALINNAGCANPGDFVFYNDLKPIQHVMDVNFYGQLRVTQALLPLFLRTAPVYGGRILNMSSVCGASASPGNSAYNASKFAVEAWSDSLRLELDPFNIKVVKIRPGQFSTSIQTQFGDNFCMNYSNASSQVKAIYGGNDHSEKIEKAFDGMQDSATDPMEAVKVLVDLVRAKQDALKSYYWVGKDARTFWRALHTLPSHVADSVKHLLTVSPEKKQLPPSNVISHVTIQVSDLTKSLPFYEAFGLTKVGEAEDGQQFLASGSSTSEWATKVLLVENKTLDHRSKSYSAGMTRLCIYGMNQEKEVKRLKALGLKPIAPTAVDKDGGVMLHGYITAFMDPDGFIVYLIEFKRIVGLFVRILFWKRKQQNPSLFHWTINVTNSIKKIMDGFEVLGFKTMSDQDSTQVANGLLPAFNIDPETTEIEHIRICHLPKDSFCSTLMQWNNPKTEKNGSELSTSMTMSVDDVDYTLDLAKQAGFTIKDPEFRIFPVYGRLRVGTIYVEPDSAPIEVVCFSENY